jgi:hypothetical protein
MIHNLTKHKTVKNGKIFTLTRDKSGDGKIDVNDLEWKYLKEMVILVVKK